MLAVKVFVVNHAVSRVLPMRYANKYAMPRGMSKGASRVAYARAAAGRHSMKTPRSVGLRQMLRTRRRVRALSAGKEKKKKALCRRYGAQQLQQRCCCAVGARMLLRRAQCRAFALRRRKAHEMQVYAMFRKEARRQRARFVVVGAMLHSYGFCHCLQHDKTLLHDAPPSSSSPLFLLVLLSTRRKVS